ncbi:MAG: aldo/keto reductase [Bryobacterales bacterium]|nr:aldo/keto reductase [Bryobacterales bacterium]
MDLKSYTTLGRTGLRVSPLCLGAMTFGTEWGWGAEEATARSIFDRYVDAGGNFIDTADGYQRGQSEQMCGKFMQERNLRDQIVLATKFTFNGTPGNPNSGGNGRKNIYRAIDASLRRLNTDFIDLYWLHAWDTITPVEEVVNTLTDLVSAGKIRHYGFSDTPAWYVARAHTLAEQQGKEGVAALQLEYSLIERNIEREHIPAAQQFGIGICPWSPLGGGFLTGKYQRQGDTGAGEGRLTKGSPFNKFTDRNWSILDVLRDVSKQAGRSPAQVALQWVVTQPGITSTILGASTLAQLNDNLASLEFTIPDDLRRRLDESSALEPVHPYVFFSGMIQGMIHGGVEVKAWTAAAGLSAQ